MDIRITGRVVTGNRIGRSMGFPTANLAIGADLPLRNGAYAARVYIEGRCYAALINIGYKPTVCEDAERTLEAHILGLSEDLYGREITVEPVRFLRAERKFDSIDELHRQIEQDRIEAERCFEDDECAKNRNSIHIKTEKKCIWI